VRLQRGDINVALQASKTALELNPGAAWTGLPSGRTRQAHNLPDYTRQYCLPEGMVQGVVTFGSPLALFYSTVANPKLDESYLTAKMFRYVLAHNIAWLHINHFKDFIAVPIPDEQRLFDVILNRTGPPIELKGGFITNSVVKSHEVNLLNAHDWYWSMPKSFAKAVANAYRTGYQSWYGAQTNP
jgi:hypothetical protein